MEDCSVSLLPNLFIFPFLSLPSLLLDKFRLPASLYLFVKKALLLPLQGSNSNNNRIPVGGGAPALIRPNEELRAGTRPYQRASRASRSSWPAVCFRRRFPRSPAHPKDCFSKQDRHQHTELPAVGSEQTNTQGSFMAENQGCLVSVLACDLGTLLHLPLHTGSPQAGRKVCHRQTVSRHPCDTWRV